MIIKLYPRFCFSFSLSSTLYRYGVRGCFRHLCYLSDLLDRAEQTIMIDPTLIHYSFAFCSSHVYGNQPDGVGSVTQEEKNKFQEVKERLRQLLEKQITNFRHVILSTVFETLGSIGNFVQQVQFSIRKAGGRA